MKKYIEQLFLLCLPVLAFTACTEDEGTEVGTDSNPALAVYSYKTKAPNDPDVDATYRVATNNKTEKVYYLAEAASAANSAESDDAIAQRVVEKGTEVTLGTDTVSGGHVADVVVKNMVGDYNVYFVAAAGNSRSLVKKTFTGLEWVDVATGTYYFAKKFQTNLGFPASTTTTLQYLATDPTQYRFKNLYSTGNSLRLVKTDQKGSDDNDSFDYFRVPAQTTPFEYGSYGTVSVRDLGYWQNDDSFAYSPNYGCYVYNDKLKNTAVIGIQYYVSAGSLGYGWDEFVPNK